jgi:hypothetical protein
MPKNHGSLEGFRDSPTALSDHLARYHMLDLGHFAGITCPERIRAIHDHLAHDEDHEHVG